MANENIELSVHFERIEMPVDYSECCLCKKKMIVGKMIQWFMFIGGSLKAQDTGVKCHEDCFYSEDIELL